MSSGYAITIQLAPSQLNPFSNENLSPGHGAVVVTTPDGQTFAGFGPLNDGLRNLGGLFSTGKFDVQNVPFGQAPEFGGRNFSAVLDHGAYETFTFPVTPDVARAVIQNIYVRKADSDGGGVYYAPTANVCTTEIQYLLRPVGAVGGNLLPDTFLENLRNIAEALRIDPNAKIFPLDVAGVTLNMPIPEGLRGLQRDTGFIGAGSGREPTFADIKYLPPDAIGPSARGVPLSGVGEFSPDNLDVYLAAPFAGITPKGSSSIRNDYAVDPVRTAILDSMRQAGIASPGTVFEYGYPDTPAPNYPFGYPQVAGLPYLGDFGQYQQLAGLGGSNFGNSAGTNFGDVLNLPVATSPSIAGGFAPQAPLPFFDFASGVGAGSGLGFGDFGFDNFTGFVNPIVLDLAGQGLNVTPLGSSNAFFDTAGDGYQHRTAWAGAGNGVLVLDLDGNGDVNSPRSFQFTTWDPTAKTDIEALAHVFGRSCRVVERRCVIVAAS